MGAFRRFGISVILVSALACSADPDDIPREIEDLRPSEDAGDPPLTPPPSPEAGDFRPPRPDVGAPRDAEPDHDSEGEEEAGPSDGAIEDAPGDEDGDALIELPDAPLEDAEEPIEGDGGDDGDAGDADPGDGGGDAGGGGDEPDGGIPEEPGRLEETGLYSNFAERTLAEGVRFYEPAFKLWSDGAEKERFIYLPPDSHIDVKNPDAWIFPVGARIYKTFSIAGRPVETRYLQKNEAGWFAATYAWNADGSATERITLGRRNALGTGYEIPDQTTCKGCHGGASDMSLGFELISLANEGATGLNLDALNAEGWLSEPLWGDYSLPGDAAAREGLGWLHANCGTACHNENPLAKGHWTGFHLHLHSRELDSVQSTAAYRTGAWVLSDFQPGGKLLYRIAPGSPEKSAIVYRSSKRGSTEQMPPMATNYVDEEGLAILRAFVEALE